MNRLRIGTCQVDLTTGALETNRDLILDRIAAAVDAGCDLVVLPEFAITGHPAGELLDRKRFVTDTAAVLEEIAAATSDVTVLVGTVGDGPDGRFGAVAECRDGRVRRLIGRRTLRDDDIHHDTRHLVAMHGGPHIVEIGGIPITVLVGADTDASGRRGGVGRLHDPDSARELDETGRAGTSPRILIATRSEPYAAGEPERRELLITDLAERFRGVSLLVNQVGGQDDLIFDGGSVAVDADGTIAGRSPQFVEDLQIVDVAVDPETGRTVIADVTHVAPDPSPVTNAGPLDDRPAELPAVAPLLEPDEEAYRAIVLGLRDYLAKNHLGEVCLGLSGGLDSALTAVIAADAIGADRVHAVLLPSRHSSDHSLTDALELAENLGLSTETVSIEPGHAVITEMLTPVFGAPPAGIADQNVQSRLRGLLLMALANENGWIVLATANKSEIAVGYTTLYGDNIGGYGPLADLYKSRVRDLARWRNGVGDAPVIPENTLTKAPSAELAPGQTDEQSLPPYDRLDPLLHDHIERGRTEADLIADGHDADLVRRVVHLVDRAEFKRHQSPIGARVTTAAFGRGRDLPVTNGYR